MVSKRSSSVGKEPVGVERNLKNPGRKSLGFVRTIIPAIPRPLPSGPWQMAQFCSNTTRPTSSVEAFGRRAPVPFSSSSVHALVASPPLTSSTARNAHAQVDLALAGGGAASFDLRGLLSQPNVCIELLYRVWLLTPLVPEGYARPDGDVERLPRRYRGSTLGSAPRCPPVQNGSCE